MYSRSCLFQNSILVALFFISLFLPFSCPSVSLLSSPIITVHLLRHIFSDYCCIQQPLNLNPHAEEKSYKWPFFHFLQFNQVISSIIFVTTYESFLKNCFIVISNDDIPPRIFNTTYKKSFQSKHELEYLTLNPNAE